MDETCHKNIFFFDFLQIRTRIIPPTISSNWSQNKLNAGPFPAVIHSWLKTWSALLDHAYSARLTRTNDGGPSTYMLTAVYHPHPGNDCVINPEPFFKLLLTAVGENVSAHLSPKQRWGGFDPGWLSVIVKNRAIEGSHRPRLILFLHTLWWNNAFGSHCLSSHENAKVVMTFTSMW